MLHHKAVRLPGDSGPSMTAMRSAASKRQGSPGETAASKIKALMAKSFAAPKRVASLSGGGGMPLRPGQGQLLARSFVAASAAGLSSDQVLTGQRRGSFISLARSFAHPTKVSAEPAGATGLGGPRGQLSVPAPSSGSGMWGMHRPTLLGGSGAVVRPSNAPAAAGAASIASSLRSASTPGFPRMPLLAGAEAVSASSLAVRMSLPVTVAAAAQTPAGSSGSPAQHHAEGAAGVDQTSKDGLTSPTQVVRQASAWQEPHPAASTPPGVASGSEVQPLIQEQVADGIGAWKPLAARASAPPGYGGAAGGTHASGGSYGSGGYLLPPRGSADALLAREAAAAAAQSFAAADARDSALSMTQSQDAGSELLRSRLASAFSHASAAAGIGGGGAGPSAPALAWMSQGQTSGQGHAFSRMRPSQLQLLPTTAAAPLGGSLEAAGPRSGGADDSVNSPRDPAHLPAPTSNDPCAPSDAESSLGRRGGAGPPGLARDRSVVSSGPSAIGGGGGGGWGALGGVGSRWKALQQRVLRRKSTARLRAVPTDKLLDLLRTFPASSPSSSSLAAGAGAAGAGAAAGLGKGGAAVHPLQQLSNAQEVVALLQVGW